MHAFIVMRRESGFFVLPLEEKIVSQTAAPEILEALISKGRVYLPNADRLMDLREKAFGTLTGDKVVLNPYETFYLLEKNRVKVLDEKSRKPSSLKELVRKFSVGKPAIWTKYLVYRDLRDRGYLVRVEDGGFDFETFGKGATRRMVSIVFEGGESTLDKLAKLSAKANDQAKDLVLAVIDRRTDIVYYTLNTQEFTAPNPKGDDEAG